MQEIKNIFTNVSNNSDPEQLEQYLADENIQSNFYFLLDRLKNLMSIFSNSNKLAESFKQKELEELYKALKNFNKLKQIVEKRYNEKTDTKYIPIKSQSYLMSILLPVILLRLE
ncbi:hypothetical protein [Rickettsia australis]|uniref:hypothetical protein n=1 Tax=Rickettsia australis TaxID=787 RepID=UPI00031980CA|nr:hypothetical protein [Rickettsia australis]